MDIGHSAAVLMDYGDREGDDSVFMTPILNPAGALADNRNLRQGSPGR